MSATALTDYQTARRNEFGRVSSATKLRKGKVTGKTAAPHDPRHTDATVRLISTDGKGPTVGQTQKLLLAAVRVWELKNGYRQ
jgi:hypothetical protein